MTSIATRSASGHEPHLDFALVVSRAALRLAVRFDRLGAVLDKIGDGLRNQSQIEVRRDRAIRDLELEIDVLVPFPEQHRRLLNSEPQVLIRHNRLRHAGERGEFVDHTFDLPGLPLDRLCQRFEQLAIFLDLGAEFSAQPLGRKLYRREGIL